MSSYCKASLNKCAQIRLPLLDKLRYCQSLLLFGMTILFLFFLSACLFSIRKILSIKIVIHFILLYLYHSNFRYFNFIQVKAELYS